MMKSIQCFLKIIVFFIILLCALALLWYFVKLKADNTKCKELLIKPKENVGFYVLIQSLSEKNNEGELLNSWRNRDNKYDIFSDENAREIADKPSMYLSDALKVVANSEYDQSQKIYTIILMQKLPIKEYLCVMDVVNIALENHVITDKDVAIQAINPDLNVKGTSLYYWWLPDWRERFKKNANTLFTEDHVNDVLKGRYMWTYPYR